MEYACGEGGVGPGQGPFRIQHRQEAVGAGVETQARQTGRRRRLIPRGAQGRAAVQFVGVGNMDL